MRPRNSFKHTAKKGTGKILERFLGGAALVSRALATGKLISHMEGDSTPNQVTSDVYVNDESTSMLQLSGVEGGGLSAASLVGLAIVALLGIIACVPLVKCLYRISRCCNKKKIKI